VTVATGTNQRPAMERFLAEIGVENLPLRTIIQRWPVIWGRWPA
jgi:hypothetical protein